MSLTDDSSVGLRGIARALARALLRLDGSTSSGTDSNGTFDMARIDERIAELKAEGTPGSVAKEQPPQFFGKRRIAPQ